MRDHSEAAGLRPTRGITTTIVIHHLHVPGPGDKTSFGSAIEFFTMNPEGVATVAVSGDYRSKLPTINRWRKEGVPPTYRRKGFVPYHFLVDDEGRVGRMLDIRAKGAHAGRWNANSVAVCALGDFRTSAPGDLQYQSIRSTILDLFAVFGILVVLSHDETLVRDNYPMKGCPGPRFPLDRLRKELRS